MRHIYRYIAIACALIAPLLLVAPAFAGQEQHPQRLLIEDPGHQQFDKYLSQLVRDVDFEVRPLPNCGVTEPPDAECLAIHHRGEELLRALQEGDFTPVSAKAVSYSFPYNPYGPGPGKWSRIECEALQEIDKAISAEPDNRLVGPVDIGGMPIKKDIAVYFWKIDREDIGETVYVLGQVSQLRQYESFSGRRLLLKALTYTDCNYLVEASGYKTTEVLRGRNVYMIGVGQAIGNPESEDFQVIAQNGKMSVLLIDGDLFLLSSGEYACLPTEECWSRKILKLWQVPPDLPTNSYQFQEN